MSKGLLERNLRVVVTGASGFLGSALVREAAKRVQWEVVGVSRRKASVDLNANFLQVESYNDLPDGDVLIDAAEPPAAIPDRGAEAELVKAVVNRVEHAVRLGYRSVVYCSSAVVYGDTVMRPRRVDESLLTTTPYAARKLRIEAAVAKHGGAIARIANVYGKGSRGVLGDIMGQIPGVGALRVRDRRPVRDFVWLDDAAEGTLRLIGKIGVYNVGTGVGTSVGDLAELCLAIAGQAQRQVVATETERAPSWLVLDVEEMHRVSGWRSQVSLESGLRRIMNGSCE